MKLRKLTLYLDQLMQAGQGRRGDLERRRDSLEVEEGFHVDYALLTATGCAPDAVDFESLRLI